MADRRFIAAINHCLVANSFSVIASPNKLQTSPGFQLKFNAFWSRRANFVDKFLNLQRNLNAGFQLHKTKLATNFIKNELFSTWVTKIQFHPTVEKILHAETPLR